MRRAFFDCEWLLAEDGQLVGLALGYDRCAEHEWGITGITTDLGVQLPEFPNGVDDRKVTVLPVHLALHHYKYGHRDRRRKAQPAAMLILERPRSWDLEVKSPQELCRAHDVGFPGEPGEEHAKDIATAWSRDGFCINVRGTEGIERLEALYEAFKRLDVAVALPWANSFFRGGLAFAIASQVPQAERAAIAQRDADHKELTLAAAATGVDELLKQAGKRFFALSPAWLDERKTEVIFFLNPNDQRHCQYGWFSVDELKAWARNEGPVVLHPELKAFAQRPENRNFSYDLVVGLHAHGITLRHLGTVTWADEAKTVPGLRIRVSVDKEHLLASGTYPFDELMNKYAAPRAVAAA